MVGATSPVCAGETSVPLPAMKVSVHEGPGYAPDPLASATEVVNTPATSAADLGEDGPWIETAPPVRVAVKPGGKPLAPGRTAEHWIADLDTAMVLNHPPGVQKAIADPATRAALEPSVKFQPDGATKVTDVIAKALVDGLVTASVRAVGVS